MYLLTVQYFYSQLQSKSSDHSEATVQVPSQLRNSAEFSEFISKPGICLVMFYTTDCVKCESLMASLYALSEQLVELSLDWRLATVNCTEEFLNGKSHSLGVICALLDLVF